MELIKIKGNDHYIFHSIDDFNEMYEGCTGESIPDIVGDWRKGEEGDWVLADDGSVCQILKKTAKLKHPQDNETTGYVYAKGYIRTAVVSVPIRAKTMLHSDRTLVSNRYRFGGVTDKVITERRANRDNMTVNETLFNQEILQGNDAVQAYMDLYKVPKEKAMVSVALLLKTTRFQNSMKQNAQEAAARLGMGADYIMNRYRGFIEQGEDLGVGLRALDKVAEIVGVDDGMPVGQITENTFVGFGTKELDPAEDDYGRLE